MTQTIAALASRQDEHQTPSGRRIQVPSDDSDRAECNGPSRERPAAPCVRDTKAPSSRLEVYIFLVSEIGMCRFKLFMLAAG